MLFAKPPLPSAYIAQFLAGEISVSDFSANVGDGWVGSDTKDWSWLIELYAIERRYNPQFPDALGSAWSKDRALADLREFMNNLRAAGR